AGHRWVAERVGRGAARGRAPPASLAPAAAVLIRPAVSLHHSIDGNLRGGRQFHDRGSLLLGAPLVGGLTPATNTSARLLGYAASPLPRAAVRRRCPRLRPAPVPVPLPAEPALHPGPGNRHARPDATARRRRPRARRHPGAAHLDPRQRPGRLRDPVTTSTRTATATPGGQPVHRGLIPAATTAGSARVVSGTVADPSHTRPSVTP